jgi:hypothetical protein
MDKKIIGLVGAISGFVSLSNVAQAAPLVTPSESELSGARSFGELLDPIPNALQLLRVADAGAAAAGGHSGVGGNPNVKLVNDHHHHHHHHKYHHHHHHHKYHHDY